MPAVLTRPKKKVVIENTFIEKNQKNTEQRKKEKRGTRKIRS